MIKQKNERTIIIGAGPGGLECARELASHGCPVLVLEKNQPSFRKICAGFWGLSEKTQKMNLPDSLFQRKFKQVVLSTQRKKKIIRIIAMLAKTHIKKAVIGLILFKIA